MNEAADDLERRADEKRAADPYAAIVATNFGFHFETANGVQAPVEFGLIPGRRPALSIGLEWLNRIAWSVGRYGHVPPEL